VRICRAGVCRRSNGAPACNLATMTLACAAPARLLTTAALVGARRCVTMAGTWAALACLLCVCSLAGGTRLTRERHLQVSRHAGTQSRHHLRCILADRHFLDPISTRVYLPVGTGQEALVWGKSEPVPQALKSCPAHGSSAGCACA